MLPPRIELKTYKSNVKPYTTITLFQEGPMIHTGSILDTKLLTYLCLTNFLDPRDPWVLNGCPGCPEPEPNL